MRNVIALLVLTACSNTAVTAGHGPLAAGEAGMSGATETGSGGGSEAGSAGEAVWAGSGGETSEEGGRASAGDGSGGILGSGGSIVGIGGVAEGGSGIGGATEQGGTTGIGGTSEGTGGVVEAGGALNIGGASEGSGGISEGSGGISESGGASEVGGSTACVPLTCEGYALEKQSQQIDNDFLIAQSAAARASGDLSGLKYKACDVVQDGCGSLIDCLPCTYPEACGNGLGSPHYQWNDTTGTLDEIKLARICSGNCKADLTVASNCGPETEIEPYYEVTCMESITVRWFAQAPEMPPYNEDSTWDIVRVDNGERVPRFTSCSNILDSFGNVTTSFCCKE